jgi:hypothetical protein
MKVKAILSVIIASVLLAAICFGPAKEEVLTEVSQEASEVVAEEGSFSFADIGLIMELHGAMDCVVAEHDASAGDSVRVKFRPGIPTDDIGTLPIAIASISKGNSLALVRLRSLPDDGFIAFPSSLCEASLAFEIPSEMMKPLEYNFP